jgi:hypothetical protein
MPGNEGSMKKEGIGTSEGAQAHRKLLKSRFSVFDGGGEAVTEAESREPLDSGEHTYHSECYACPVGKAFQGISEAAHTDAFEGVLDALADLIRAGTKLVETVAQRAAGSPVAKRTETIERITVE